MLGVNSLIFRKGCELMGYSEHRHNFRNCKSCMQCGLCHLGCHYETKQDMRVTYLHRALNHAGSRVKIYCNCSAERVTHSGGIIDGVEGHFLDSSGIGRYKIRVDSKLVVISAGSIASTELLLKSSIAEGKAGKGLALHPVPFVLGDFPFPLNGIRGIPMTYTLHDFGVANGVEDGGFLVEGTFLPPLQLSLLLSISGGRHGELMMRYNHYAMAGVLVRYCSNGTITLNDRGLPRVDYTLQAKELETIAQGVEVISRMWFALGASRMVTPHMNRSIIKGPEEVPLLL